MAVARCIGRKGGDVPLSFPRDQEGHPKENYLWKEGANIFLSQLDGTKVDRKIFYAGEGGEEASLGCSLRLEQWGGVRKNDLE